MMAAEANVSLLPPYLPLSLLRFTPMPHSVMHRLPPLSLQCLQPMPDKCVCGADATVLLSVAQSISQVSAQGIAQQSLKGRQSVCCVHTPLAFRGQGLFALG